MTNEFSNADPLPALPLEYYERHSGPWAAVMRIMAWVGAVYSIAVIAAELMYVLVYALSIIISPRSFGMNLFTSLVPGLFPAVVACVLLVGSAMSLKFQKQGRALVLGASMAVVAGWLLAFGITEFEFVLARGIADPVYCMYQTASIFFLNFHRALPAIVLWVIFRRREVQDVFEG